MSTVTTISLGVLDVISIMVAIALLLEGD